MGVGRRRSLRRRARLPLRDQLRRRGKQPLPQRRRRSLRGRRARRRASPDRACPTSDGGRISPTSTTTAGWISTPSAATSAPQSSDASATTGAGTDAAYVDAGDRAFAQPSVLLHNLGDGRFVGLDRGSGGLGASAHGRAGHARSPTSTATAAWTSWSWTSTGRSACSQTRVTSGRSWIAIEPRAAPGEKTAARDPRARSAPPGAAQSQIFRVSPSYASGSLVPAALRPRGGRGRRRGRDSLALGPGAVVPRAWPRGAPGGFLRGGAWNDPAGIRSRAERPHDSHRGRQHGSASHAVRDVDADRGSTSSSSSCSRAWAPTSASRWPSPRFPPRS